MKINLDLGIGLNEIDSQPVSIERNLKRFSKLFGIARNSSNPFGLHSIPKLLPARSTRVRTGIDSIEL